MQLTSSLVGLAERIPLPDPVIRVAIAHRCSRTAASLGTRGAVSDAEFASTMALRTIAEHADLANAQHYELPASFFGEVLGPRRKYSCCYYEQSDCTLRGAEDEALRRTIENAGLSDGQSVLELGCGWGAVSLEIARRFPHSVVTAVSNSHAQGRHIETEAAREGLENVRVVTADMNTFDPAAQFDRVVSVEMFEHMMNWRQLLTRIRHWLTPDGLLFLHVFSHRSGCYAFDHARRDDWIARHFFTGGIMPSHDLIRQYEDLFTVQQSWRWDGRHYQRTALHWLERFDRNREAIGAILHPVYGAETSLWMRRWRWFFLATAGLFGFAGGSEWGVSHFRLEPTVAADRPRPSRE